MTAAPTRADVERYTAGGIHATIECGRDDDQPTDFVDATDYDALLSREAQLREALEWIDNIATMNYEQDEQLRHNGARTLIRISDKARAALNTRSDT